MPLSKACKTSYEASRRKALAEMRRINEPLAMYVKWRAPDIFKEFMTFITSIKEANPSVKNLTKTREFKFWLQQNSLDEPAETAPLKKPVYILRRRPLASVRQVEPVLNIIRMDVSNCVMIDPEANIRVITEDGVGNVEVIAEGDAEPHKDEGFNGEPLTDIYFELLGHNDEIGAEMEIGHFEDEEPHGAIDEGPSEALDDLVAELLKHNVDLDFDIGNFDFGNFEDFNIDVNNMDYYE